MKMNYTDWLYHPDIRPYVFTRKENLPVNPGSVHKFSFPEQVLMKDPFFLDQADFATQIITMENKAFASSGMIIPRWALYDCSIMPGLVVGFVIRTKSVNAAIRKVLPIDEKSEWTPISLFICIPTAKPEHWVAHNLCSVSSLLSEGDRMPALGFLTKAFGLWYFNIRHQYGMTQWNGGAVKVHANMGLFEIKTAYTPIHDYPGTITYLMEPDSHLWLEFLENKVSSRWGLKPSGITIDPEDKNAMIALHKRIENGEGPFYLNGKDFLVSDRPKHITIYKR